VVRYSRRNNIHEYLVEIFEGEKLVIGGVPVESKTELSSIEILNLAISKYYAME
jgi:hypothetical protein